MNLFSRIKILGPIGLCVAGVGGTACDGIGGKTASTTVSRNATQDEAADTKAPQQQQQQQQDESAGQQQEAKQQSAQHGVLALVGEALTKVCLSDAQRTAVDGLGKQVAITQNKVHDARRALMTALSDQFKAGKIDEAAIKDKIDALVKAKEAAAPVLYKTIDELHAILDKGQRATFSDAIQMEMKDIRGASSKWSDSLSKDLNLESDQKSKIEEAVAKAKPALAEEHATTKAAFDAFRGDDFSMEKVAPVAQIGERARNRAKNMITLAKEIAGILTPEQRADLVKKIEAKKAEKDGEMTAPASEKLGPQAEKSGPAAEQQTAPQAEKSGPAAEQKTAPQAEKGAPQEEQVAPQSEQVVPQAEQIAYKAEQAAPAAEKAAPAAEKAAMHPSCAAKEPAKASEAPKAVIGYIGPGFGVYGAGLGYGADYGGLNTWGSSSSYYSSSRSQFVSGGYYSSGYPFVGGYGPGIFW